MQKITVLIVLAFMSFAFTDGGFTISGEIKDKDGNNVPFAIVITNKERSGIAADKDGYFLLTTKMAFDSITISAAGYLPQKVKVTNKSKIVVVLEKSDLGQKLRYVVGCGSRRRNIKPKPTCIDTITIELTPNYFL